MLSSNTLLAKPKILVGMAEQSINQVFAKNLEAIMNRKELSQMALATKSGVSQKTVSNYLNPGQRPAGAKGKQASAKLTEIALIAAALEVPPWRLLRPLDEKQSVVYDAVESAISKLTPSQPPTISRTGGQSRQRHNPETGSRKAAS